MVDAVRCRENYSHPRHLLFLKPLKNDSNRWNIRRFGVALTSSGSIFKAIGVPLLLKHPKTSNSTFFKDLRRFCRSSDGDIFTSREGSMASIEIGPFRTSSKVFCWRRHQSRILCTSWSNHANKESTNNAKCERHQKNQNQFDMIRRTAKRISASRRKNRVPTLKALVLRCLLSMRGDLGYSKTQFDWPNNVLF